MSTIFFNPDIETMAPDKLRETVIYPKLREQIRYVLENSQFYRKKIRESRIDTLVENFERIPFTEKSEILADQNEFPPFGRNLCVGKARISRIHRTSGTTARPIFIALTKKDIDTTVRVGGRCFWSSGLRPGDTVVHCLNYCLWMGGYTDHQSLEATGATVVPYGVGNTLNLIQTIREMQIDAIHCTPSYLARIEDLLKSEFNLCPKDLGLKRGLFGGESGIQNPLFRKQIEDRWGLVAMNANYGLSDVLSMFGAECPEQNGLHFMGMDAVLPEIIGENGVSIPIEKGVRGELVLTSLEKEAQPLIRFRTHDIIEILGTDCPCGRTGFRFRILGRSDDMFVVKGINVFPQAIGDVINEYLDVFNGEFQITATKAEPIEKIVLAVEMRQQAGKQGEKEMKKILLEQLHQRLNISPEIRILPEGALPRTQGKSRRFIRV